MNDKFPSITDVKVKKELNHIMHFVLWLRGKYWLPSNDTEIDLMIKKDIIVHIWSIIEWILFYIVDKWIENWKICIEHTDSKINKIHTINDTECIAHVRITKKAKISKKLDFQNLIDSLHDKEFITKELKKDLHDIREMRNWVHISKNILSDVKFLDIDLENNFMPLYKKIIWEIRPILISVSTVDD